MGHSKSAISEYWISIAGNGSGDNMGLGYDIFRELSDGNPLWIGQAATLKEAEDKLDTLARTLPAKYFIRDAASATIVARLAPNTSADVKG